MAKVRVVSSLVLLARVATAGAHTCDIFGAGGTPCVAAHSTVRALYSDYAGCVLPLLRDGS